MKNTKRKHLKLCLLLLFMVLGCFAITNVRTTTVQASSRTFKSNGRTYMEKHNDNTLNTVLYQKVSGRYKQVAKSSRYPSTDFLMERNCIFQVLTMKEQVLPAHIRKAKMDLNLNEARWY